MNYKRVVLDGTLKYKSVIDIKSSTKLWINLYKYIISNILSRLRNNWII